MWVWDEYRGGSKYTKHMGKKKEEETLIGDNENFVGNKAEATRRGKGTGPSCLNKKAFSCHLACRTGFIISFIFFLLRRH